MKLLPQLFLLLTFCNCHYESPSTALCATDILFLLLWSSIHSPVSYWHSLSLIMNFLPQPSVLLSFSTSHYEAPSTILYATYILYLSLWSSFHSYVCYWLSVPVFMKLLPHLCVLLTFWTCHYESPSTALCATAILYLSLWSSFHSSVCFLLSVPLIMNLLPQLSVLLTFCTCHYETPSTALCATGIQYLSLYCSFHSSFCYWHSERVIVNLLPQLAVLLTFCSFLCELLPHLCVLLTFCTCLYEFPSIALCATNFLYLSLWSSFISSVCYWHSLHVIMKLLLQLCVLLTLQIKH